MSFFFFYKIKEQEGRPGPAWGEGYQWVGEEYGERVKEGEYSTNTVYTCI
jgi:hypothetical protein